MNRIIVLASCLLTWQTFNTAQAVIYGNDDRKDFYQIRDQKWKEWSKATLAVFDEKTIFETDEGNFALGDSDGHINRHNQTDTFCSGEPFAGQPTDAICSSFVVAPNLVMTSSHCIRKRRECQSSYFVSGYWKEKRSSDPIQFDRAQVFRCDEIVARSAGGYDAPDWVLIRLDRNFKGAEPLELSDLDPVGISNSPVLMLGYPDGMPLKSVLEKTPDITTSSSEHRFDLMIDVFAGNSGSPVMDTVTGKVIGMMSESPGEDYFETDQGCWARKQYTEKIQGYRATAEKLDPEIFK